MYLKRIVKNNEISIYEINHKESPYRRFLFSTPQTRLISNEDIVGVEFKEALCNGAALALQHNPKYQTLAHTRKKDISRIANLIILRVGLNFALDTALYKAFKLSGVHNSFLTSERQDPNDNAEFKIGERGYWKPRTRRYSTNLLGDIVASGESAFNGLCEFVWDVSKRPFSKLPLEIQAKLDKERELKGTDEERPIKEFIFFPLGSNKLEQKYLVIHNFFQQIFAAHYQGASFNYYEGIFDMIEPEEDTSNKKIFRTDRNHHILYPNTDLIHRKNAQLSLEYITSLLGDQGENLCPEEIILRLGKKCVIMDGGRRGFESHDAYHEKREYFKALLKLAKEEGITIEDLLKEKEPDLPFRTSEKEFCQTLGEVYLDIPETEFQELHIKYHKAMKSIQTKHNIKDPNSLRDIMYWAIGKIDGM